jgi:hypothetical protein
MVKPGKVHPCGQQNFDSLKNLGTTIDGWDKEKSVLRKNEPLLDTVLNNGTLMLDFSKPNLRFCLNKKTFFLPPTP